MDAAWSYIIGGIVTAFVVGEVSWAARQLLKHAEVLSTVTAELKQLPVIQSDVSALAEQVTEVRIEQARVATQLATAKP